MKGAELPHIRQGSIRYRLSAVCSLKVTPTSFSVTDEITIGNAHLVHSTPYIIVNNL